MNIFCCDPNDINLYNYKDIQKNCIDNNVEWRNQTYISFITELKQIFDDNENGRIKFTKNERDKLLTKFENKCNICKCCIKDNIFDIDHIMPLSGGGNNNENNLQVLCKSCHFDKSSSENEQGQYFKTKETASFLNEAVKKIMDSTLAQNHAFVEHAREKSFASDKKIFCIDIYRNFLP